MWGIIWSWRLETEHRTKGPLNWNFVINIDLDGFWIFQLLLVYILFTKIVCVIIEPLFSLYESTKDSWIPVLCLSRFVKCLYLHELRVLTDTPTMISDSPDKRPTFDSNLIIQLDGSQYIDHRLVPKLDWVPVYRSNLKMVNDRDLS